MKKIKSILGPSTMEAFASNLSRLGFSEQANIIVAAEKALADRNKKEAEADSEDDDEDINTILEDDSESEDDSDEEDCCEDDSDDMDDVMQDSGIEDDEDDSETLALDPGVVYSEADIKKLRRICRSCLDEGKHVHAARNLLKAIKNYEAAR